jgi:hypothetical protein
MITLTADGQYDLYVNGAYIGSDDGWIDAHTYTVPCSDAENLIAIKAQNDKKEAGLLVEIHFKDKIFVSNEMWKIATEEQPDWNTVHFNDTDWLRATSYGLHGGAEPWALYSNVQNISTNKGVKWIWSSDHLQDNVVFFRYRVREEIDTNPPNTPSGIRIK